MRLPNHIILDFENHKKQNNNWYNEFLSQSNNYPYVFNSFNINKKFLPGRYSHLKLINKQHKYTIQHSQFFKKSRLRKLNLVFNFPEGRHAHTFTDTLRNLVNINFLRKERLYTKLKYSRSPAYDIVSGGAAALLAGFIGFLISEKFGYELVDSGDFYYAFMYVVFLVFSLKPLLTVSDSKKGFIQMVSLKPLLGFYSTLIKLVLIRFK